MSTLIGLLLSIAFWYGIYRLYRHFNPKKSKSSNLSDYYEGSASAPSTSVPTPIPQLYDAEAIITCILSNCTDFDDDDPAEQSFDDFRVAGITFHDFSDADNGMVFGYAKREPWNTHDSNAIALYSWDDRHLGYIARDQQDDFNDFTLQDCIPITCLITQFLNDDDKLTPCGEVTLYKGTEDALKEALTDYFPITDKIPLL